jgi:hypothetical protein
MSLAGNRFNHFFKCKGKSDRYTLIAVTRDEHQDADMFIYYIGLDNLVGIVLDGVNAWVAPIEHSLHVFGKGVLAALIEKVKAGEPVDVEMPRLPRKRLEIHVEFPTILRRRLPLRHREVTNG